MIAQTLLEEVIATRVKGMYLHSMRNNFAFHEHPYFNIELFRKYFAMTAHTHGIFHCEQPDKYNHFFKLAKAKLEEAIRLLAENEERIHPKGHMDPVEARQRLLALRNEIAARQPRQF